MKPEYFASFSGRPTGLTSLASSSAQTVGLEELLEAWSWQLRSEGFILQLGSGRFGLGKSGIMKVMFEKIPNSRVETGV